MPVVYKSETYEVVSKWMAETPIEYGPNTKRGKSYDRYDAYSKATTVGEALRLKSKPEDLLFDYEHGHLKPLGGPVREAAIDPTSVTDLSKLTKTDMVVSKWAGWGFRESDEARKLVRQLADGSFKVVIMDFISEHRKEANNMAASILEQAQRESRKIREGEVLRVLREWRFVKNDARQNVMPEGQDFVFSDTLGLTRSRDGRYLEKEATREWPDVTRLLCRWLKDQRPAELPDDFPFTSINVNFKYGARRHRDGNNCGPSMIKALGKFTGGELGYFPDDNHTQELSELPAAERVTLNLKSGVALFNGNCAHEVDAFEGERYSLVFFSIGKYWKTPDEVRDLLVDCGISWPTEETMDRARALLRKPAGYGKGRQAPSADSAPGVRQWHTDPAELAEADAELEGRPPKGNGPAPGPRPGGAAPVAAKKRGRPQAAAPAHGSAAAAASDAGESLPTPARKRGRKEAAETPTKAVAEAEGPGLDEGVLQKDVKEGLRTTFLNLSECPEIEERGLKAPALLAALRQNGGLVDVA